MGIGTLGGGDFFQVGLENSSEYESQTNKKNFFVSCSYGLGKFQISWGTSVFGGPNFYFGKGRLGHFLP